MANGKDVLRDVFSNMLWDLVKALAGGAPMLWNGGIEGRSLWIGMAASFVITSLFISPFIHYQISLNLRTAELQTIDNKEQAAALRRFWLRYFIAFSTIMTACYFIHEYFLVLR